MDALQMRVGEETWPGERPLASDARRRERRGDALLRALAAERRRSRGYAARVRELEDRLVQLAEQVRTDPLTGVCNRRGLDDAFLVECARSEREGTKVCVAVFDLDDFKKLNDCHGHAVGDCALRHVARVLRTVMRPTDVVARIGGEEFVVLFPGAGLQEAVCAVERARAALECQPCESSGERIELRVSAGVAGRFPGEDSNALLARADAALYEAKRRGKNRVQGAQG